MSYILSDAPQGTDAWRLARLGRLTGSIADEALSFTAQTSHEKGRARALKLAIERITGNPVDRDEFKSRDIERGHELEPFARMAYEARTGAIVREVGFAYLPTIMAGASPDGFVDDDGIIEAKCPRPHVHARYLLSGGLPREYLAQVIHNLWITGRTWCDFVSFCDEMPEKLQLFVYRFDITDKDSEAYQRQAMRFLFEVSDLENQLREKMK